jgi:hypothetical protein
MMTSPLGSGPTGTQIAKLARPIGNLLVEMLDIWEAKENCTFMFLNKGQAVGIPHPFSIQMNKRDTHILCL